MILLISFCALRGANFYENNDADSSPQKIKAGKEVENMGRHTRHACKCGAEIG